MDVSKPAPSNQVMSGCHGDHHDAAEPQVNTPSNCCDDGCSMMGCHSASGLLSSINPPQFHARTTQNQSFNTGVVAHVSSSLYRPPILR